MRQRHKLKHVTITFSSQQLLIYRSKRLFFFMFLFLTKFKSIIPIIILAILGLVAGGIFGVKSRQQTKVISNVSAGPSTTAVVPTSTPRGPIVHKVSSPMPRINAQPVARVTLTPRAPVLTRNGPVNWGVTIRPYLTPDQGFNRAFLPKQFVLMKELGVTSVRADYDFTHVDMNDLIVAQARQHKMQLIFILPMDQNQLATDKNLSSNVYRQVYDVVKKYKGQVAVWQLGTEVATVAMKKPDMNGIEFTDYPEETYRPVATWIQAASRATIDADPRAKRLLNDQWIHAGFFKKFLAEGGQFDILGWNWFSDMGGPERIEELHINDDPNRPFRLMDTLKSYNKELWFAEVNRRDGDSDGNPEAQADFIASIAQYANANQRVSTFLVFLLIGEAGYGIADANYQGGTVSGVKKAFTRYQQIIDQSR